MVRKMFDRVIVKTRLGVYSLLLFYLFFDSYRYVWGEGGIGTTSEGATPFFANVLKVIIWIVLIIYPLIVAKKITVGKDNIIVFLLLIIVTVEKIYLMLVMGSFDNKDILLMMMIATTISYIVCNCRVELSVIDKIVMYFFVFTTVYDILQFFLAVNLIKLPRHAYLTGNIQDIRFGGAWDDPNSYGIFMSFYLVYFYNKYRGMKRWWGISFSGLNLVMTWSITGMICSLISLSVFILSPIRKNRVKLSYLINGMLLLIGALIVIYVYSQDLESFIIQISDSKYESAEQHMSGWRLNDFTVLNFLGLFGGDYFSEIGLMNMLYSGGVILVACFYLLGGISIYKCINKSKKQGINGYSSVLYGAAGYQLAVMVSTINLPLQTVWPIGCMYYFFILLSTIKFDEVNRTS